MGELTRENASAAAAGGEGVVAGVWFRLSLDKVFK